MSLAGLPPAEDASSSVRAGLLGAGQGCKVLVGASRNPCRSSSLSWDHGPLREALTVCPSRRLLLLICEELPQINKKNELKDVDRQFPVGEKQMASKQVKRCRTLLVIRERLLEIRDIILQHHQEAEGEVSARAGEEQQQPETRPCLGSPPLQLTPNQHVVGVWKSLLYARKHRGLSARRKFRRVTTAVFVSLACPGHTRHRKCSWEVWRLASPPPPAPSPWTSTHFLGCGRGLSGPGLSRDGCHFLLSGSVSGLQCSVQPRGWCQDRTARRRWVFTETEMEMESLGRPGCYCCF